jgi:3-isopropylmalate dehydrogenase
MSSTTNRNKIAVIGGEGIGVEVTAQSRRVLAWFAEHRGTPIKLRDAEYGKVPYLRSGEVIPAETWDAIWDSDAILFGATGGPETEEVPTEARNRDSLLSLRRKLDLYANVRPIYAHPELHEASPLKSRVLQGVDFIIVRELSSGIYFGEPRGIETLPDGGRRGFNTQSYTTDQVHRVARFSFELARRRRGRLCSVDKANVLETSVMWREEVTAIHRAEFPDVELSHMYVDNAAMQVVRAPSQFDVVVTCNIFGDILSDCAAVAAGSLGMLPSASFGPVDQHGRQKALYEPVHGSAPDIAGKGIANPLGSIQSLPLMLRLTLRRPDDAALLERAIAAVLAGGLRTADLVEPGKTPVSTEQMGDAVLQALAALA